MRGERQGEVAIAAVEFEQVGAAARLCRCPVKHLLADGGVGLAEAVFVLAVAVVAPADAEGFRDVVLADDALFAARAADEMHAEFGGKRFRRLLPGVIERAVVDEAEHGLARLSRLKFCLKEAVAQGRAVVQGDNHLWHQAVNRRVRGREDVGA